MPSHNMEHSSGHPKLIFLDSASITMINNKGLNIEPIWSRKSLKVPLTLTHVEHSYTPTVQP